MRRIISTIVLLCLLAPAAGAAGQGIVVERSAGYWRAYAEKLPIGATVRVRTTDGRRHTAVLSMVEQEGITVELKSRVPEPARRISYDQIQQLELKNNGASVVKAVAVGVAIGAGTFLGLLMLVAANWD